MNHSVEYKRTAEEDPAKNVCSTADFDTLSEIGTGCPLAKNLSIV